MIQSQQELPHFLIVVRDRFIQGIFATNIGRRKNQDIICYE